MPKSQEWKPVELSGYISCGSHAKDLIAIEELTDYKILRQDNNHGKKSQGRHCENIITKKTLKRKNTNIGSNCHLLKKRKKKNIFQVEDLITEKDHVDVDPLDFLPWDNIYVPREIAKSLLEQGFKCPTEVQSKAIPAAIKGRKDLLGAAQTGSGKTLAFGIPIIYGIMKAQHIAKEESNIEEDLEVINNSKKFDIPYEEVQGTLLSLILTPTRELAIQIKQQLDVAAKYTSIKIAVIIGGMSNEKQERLLNKRPQIVVATPGRLWEFLSHPHFANIEHIRFLAIDETDRMLEKEHFPELRKLLEKINLNSEARNYRQNFVFSATLSFVHDPPKHLKKKRIKAIKLTSGQKLQNIMDTLGIINPKIVDITPKTGTAEKLLESKILCSLKDKDSYLYYFLVKHSGKTLVFCNSISCVRRLTSVFSLLKMKPLPIHSEMHQRQRLKNLDRFREGTKALLLATDVMARGLDIPDVQHVIHFQVPRTFESYVHRSGRTARAEKEGLTLLLIEPSEVKLYIKLCSSLNRSNDLPAFPVDEMMVKKIRRIVDLAKEIDQFESQLKKHKLNFNWFEETAKKVDIILDEEIPKKQFQEELAVGKSGIKHKRKELSKLLATLCSSQNTEISAVKTVKSVSGKFDFKIYKKK